jgi:hypothetical protein
MDKKHILWQSASDVLCKTEHTSTATSSSSSSVDAIHLDNDPVTLEKERATFEQKLRQQVNPAISIFSIEGDEDGYGDRFVLNTSSLTYIDKIKDFFKDNAVQYEVGVGIHSVPIEGGPSKFLTPRQQTVHIYRKAVLKLKRSPLLTFAGAAVCLALIAFFVATFLRIVV